MLRREREIASFGQALRGAWIAGTAAGGRGRTVSLLPPLIEDLDEWRDASAARAGAPLFAAASGGFWRATDWRNWRKRIYRPTAQSVGIDGARPYDPRHAFASLLIHEGRMSIVELAAQLGHNPTVCLDTYAHVMAKQAGGEP
jgi:integrase